MFIRIICIFLLFFSLAQASYRTFEDDLQTAYSKAKHNRRIKFSMNLSNAFNGFVEECDRTKRWQEDIIEKFTDRADERELIGESVKHSLLDSTLYNENAIDQNKAIHNFFNCEIRKVNNQKIIFESRIGDPKNNPQNTMKDMTIMGKSSQLKRNMIKLEKQFYEINSQIYKLKKDQNSNEETKTSILQEKNECEIKIKQIIEKIVLNDFMKYMSWFNIYSSLKNTEFDYYNRQKEVQTLFSVLNSIIKSDYHHKDLTKRSLKNIKSIFEDLKNVIFSVNDYCCKLDNNISNQNNSISHKIIESTLDFLKNILIRSKQNNTVPFEIIELTLESNLNFLKNILMRSECRQELFSPPSMTILIENKVAHYFEKLKKFLKENKEAISVNYLSALNIVLLNNNYKNPQRAEMTSVQFMQNSFIAEELEETKIAMQKNKNYWKLGIAQLRMRFSDYGRNKEFEERRQSILSLMINYIQNKLSKTDPKVQNETLSQEEMASKAALKMISYMGMVYSLIYDFEGKKTSELKFFPDEIAEYVKEIPTSLSLDRVLMAKALKWHEKLNKLEKSDKFIVRYTLETHTLAKKN